MGEPVLARLATGQAVHAALGQERFVPAAALPAGVGYEAFVAETGQVPTRDNLHDLFNGLVWLKCPGLKSALNRAHMTALTAAPQLSGRRGPLRDALTLLDESGLRLRGPVELAEALRARDWRRLFLDLRPAWREAEVLVVGHALLEKLLHPRKPLCARVLCGEALPESPAELPPLPVLGIPGWWPANEAPGFYDDARVFRPG